MNVLTIDIGGTGVKILVTGETERRRFESGPTITPELMVAGVKQLAGEWKYDAVSIGYPGPVRHNRPLAEPHNLASGWVGFNFEDDLGLRGLERLGRKKWEKRVHALTNRFVSALILDEVVFGGGNAKNRKKLPDHCRLGTNNNAFLGGFRLWENATK